MSLKFSDDATFTNNFPKQPPCLSQLLEILFLLDYKELKFKKNKATMKVLCSHSIRSKLSILLTFLPCPETNTFNRVSGSIYAGVLKECIWWNFFSPKFKALFHINEMPRIIKHFKKRIIFYHKFIWINSGPCIFLQWMYERIYQQRTVFSSQQRLMLSSGLVWN